MLQAIPLLNRFFILIVILSPCIINAGSYDQATNKIEEKMNAEKNIQDYAISADGRYLLVVREQSQSVELLNAKKFSLIKTLTVSDAETGHANTNIDFVFSANTRDSFIVGMGASNQLWEILYEENPLPVYNGIMHDYRLGEGLVRDQSHFPIRIIPLVKTDISISSYYLYETRGLLFINRDKNIEVIQLDARQTIAKITFKIKPNLTASKMISKNDTPHLFVPFLDKQGVTMINIKTWAVTETKQRVK